MSSLCFDRRERGRKMRGKNPLILTTTNEVKLQLHTTRTRKNINQKHYPC